MAAYVHISEEVKSSFTAVELELEMMYTRACHKCGERLREYSCRKLGENYGRRFVRCPGYELPTTSDGTPILPLHTEWSILSQNPKTCHFEWIDLSCPECAITCIRELIRKLKSAKSEVERLKEELLLGSTKE